MLPLIASAANTVVLECIARNVPLLVSRANDTEYYLGKKYPLFFNECTEEEIRELLTPSKLREGYRYLVNMDKSDLYGDSFLKNLSSAPFYRALPLPLG